MDAPTEEPQLRELIETHTALDLYLSALKHIIEGNPGSLADRLGEIIDGCIGQSQRAHDVLRQLRRDARLRPS